VRLDSDSPDGRPLDRTAFRRRTWIAGALAILALVVVALVMAHMSADRREDAIADRLDRLVTTVAWPHRAYLAPRVAIVEQTIALLASADVAEPGGARAIAAAAMRQETLPGVALLAYRAASGERLWTIAPAGGDGDLGTLEHRLDESSAADPGAIQALAADLSPWGRTLVVRFPVAGQHAGDSMVEVIRLDPLYDDLFPAEIRASFALQIHDARGLVWGEAGDPPAFVRSATYSFRVAGQHWMMRAWPHPQWLARERRAEWWEIARLAVPTVLVLAIVVVGLLLWWGRLTRQVLLAERRTRLIVDKALDAVISMDDRGIITGWNAHAELTFGWRADEAIGRSLAFTIVPPQHRQAHTEGLQRFLATGAAQVLNKRIEITAWHRDGHEFPVELSISPIPLRDTYTFTAFVRDITDRKRTEEELRGAKDSAEAANRAKSEFLATMSHEIRTPMNGIFGMTELALDTHDDAERRDFLVRARACAESLMTIINDVLDFSKIEAGKLDLECIEFEARGVLDGVLDTLAIEAARKKLELVGVVDESVPARLRGDPGRLRQIIMNLAGNALKFTDYGEIVIRLECAEPAGGPPLDPVSLRCTVRDTGIGIPADKQQRIFESFTQADSSTTRRYGGTGLGLAISQRLVTMMGGTIGVESEAGRGSTFWLVVPLGLAEAARTADPRVALAGLRVLVVDDNATNRMFLLKTLQGWGCRPALASGGAEAFDLLAHAARSGEPFEVVLLDMHMPDLDGGSTAHRIRKEPSTRDVPIIALTSISRSMTERAQELRFAALLPKPVKQAQLLDALLASARPDVPGPPAADASVSQAARILVVDDNEANRIVAETVLRRAGYDVHLASDGREAIRAVARFEPDLVLMDVQMPDLDGLAATAAIRAAEVDRRTPVLALTAATDADDRERCMAAGMDGYVGKPIRREDLLRAVATALTGARHAAVAASPTDGHPASAPARPAPAAAAARAQPEPEDDLLDADLMAEITGRFLDDAITRCQALRVAVQNGEAQTVEHIGHYIKGGAAQLAIEGVRELGAALETLGRSGHLEPAARLVALLEEAIASARDRVPHAMRAAQA
jgi:PAS domain S-box-containing protein